MSIKKFKESEIPYEKLEKVGLTRQMLEDLPEDALDRILAGHLSPVLPLLIQGPSGEEYEGRGRFSIYIKPEGELSLKIHPVMQEIGETIQIGQINPENGMMEAVEVPASECYDADIIQRLKEGQVVLNFMYGPDGHRQKAFLQLDPETNQIMAVQAQNVGRNLQIVTAEFKLTGAEETCLQNGHLITYTNEEDEMLTVGLDLNSPTGIRFAIGDEKQWMENKKRDWDKYELGVNGCWMTDDDGNLQYVSEDEFEEYDIWNEVEKQREHKKQNEPVHRGLPMK